MACAVLKLHTGLNFFRQSLTELNVPVDNILPEEAIDFISIISLFSRMNFALLDDSIAKSLFCLLELLLSLLPDSCLIYYQLMLQSFSWL